MARATRIPIFPLEVVLFPGVQLPLHIFEPRYRQMVKQRLENHSEFGVVLARPEGVAAVGCTAEISSVVKRYPDGRLDILAIGRAVFHIEEVFDENPLVEANVQYVEPDPEAPSTEETQKVLRLYEECHRLIFGKPASRPELSAGALISFVVAGELPLDLEYKQELLEEPSEAARLHDLAEKLENWIPKLEQMRRVRRVAGGNGKALH